MSSKGPRVGFFLLLLFTKLVGMFMPLLAAASSVASPRASWPGPTEGPQAQSHKRVAFLMSDAKNGGVMGVKVGFMEATRVLAWKVDIYDGAGNMEALNQQLAEILKKKLFDGIVLCGFQPDAKQLAMLQAKKKQFITVGWHAAIKPGVAPGLFTNVSTDPVEVAQLTIQALGHTGSKKPGVILISDSHFAIANEKAALLAKSVKECDECHLLAVEDIPIARAQEEISNFVHHMNEKFGKLWTHTIAINDIYFDNMNFPLREVNRLDIRNLAAGDGSEVAISRIKSGASQQAVTIAEPLKAQGWQVADELNRGFAGQKESAYVSKPIVVTKEYLESLPSDDIEGSTGFREAYSKIWQKHP